MKKRSKSLIFALVAGIMCSSLAGCNKATEEKGTNKMSSVATSTVHVGSGEKSSNGEREKISFWYLWGGDEAKLIEQMITAYNKSQDKYEVVGTSTPDQQVIITAISGGQGPDITDDFGGNVPKYANENIAQNLDEFMKKDNFDASAFVDSALEQQKYDGSYYALPISVNTFALYYNKDLLDKAGITKLPTTLEELMELSEKTTVVDNGVMKQIGAPFVPANYWPTTFAYAFGSDFGTPGNLTPDNEGFKKSLEFMESQVKKFGKDTMGNFVTSGNANLNTPQDPFLNGTQVFRIDGPWFYNMAKEAKVNFGMIPMPGAKSVNSDGWSIIDTSMLYISSTSTHKEGAWDFMKYMCMGDGNKLFCTLKGDLPPTKALLKDPEIASKSEAYGVYLDIIAKNNLRGLPSFLQTTEYSKAIRDAVNNVLLGDTTDKALSDLKEATKTLK